MVSDDLKKLFPHDKIREGQSELIEDTNEAFESNKILIAHAPTGLGKTASALTVALHHAIKDNKTILFLTNRHTQHKIAIDTLKEIKKKTDQQFHCVDLIGKRWMCSQKIAGIFGTDFNEYCKSLVEKGECEYYNKVKQKNELQVEAKLHMINIKNQLPLHTEELIDQTKQQDMCSYEIAIALAKDAKVIIGDYYYLFNPHVQASLLKKLEIELEDIIVIVDEGHNLPNRITEMLSNNLTTYMLKNAMIEAKKFNFHGLIVWLQGINEILTKLSNFAASDRDKEKLIRRDQFIQEINIKTEYDELINELELAADEVRKKQRKSYLGGIATFLETWQGDDDGYVRMISEHIGNYGPVITLKYSCLDPSLITREIFKRVHAGIIMSGTLKPTFMYKDILGISQALEKEYSSPFPPENKRTIVVPDTSTKFTLRGDAMYQRIANHCATISNATPGNIALFFPSYYLRDQISPFINSEKKRFWEKQSMSKEEKEQLLNDFKEEKHAGGILLGVTGANFAEGVDFPGDLLKAVVVIGIPLAKPDLQTKQVIEYYNKKYNKGWDYGYMFPAFSKCIQSAGRCIRSGTDRGVVVYLDERFAWQRYYDCFPDKVGLMVTKNYDKIIESFFGTFGN